MPERNNSTCVVLSASAEPADLYAAIRDHLARMGVRAVFSWEIDAAEGIARTLSLIQQISRADLVIADISGYPPNVMYELGLARGRRIPAFLMVEGSSGTLPSDLWGELVFVYDRGLPVESEQLGRLLEGWVRDSLRRTGELLGVA